VLAERSGLTAKDCLAPATILAAKDDPAAALTWIREFEKVVTGVTPEPEPSFLGKARARWAPPE
jgi:hypothetical protein